MSALRKITVNLPADLLDGAMAQSGKGLTETIRDALEFKRSAAAWERMRQMRGKVDFGATWQQLAGKHDDE